MRELRYRILNVFTVRGDRLSGNPLCVFEDGSSLSDLEMQALARQLNLSETTFVLPSELPTSTANARVRIFTPTFEMPFAGHPTLGTSHVVRSLYNTGDSLVLEMKAGLVAVTCDSSGGGSMWKLKTARKPEKRVPSSSREEIAAMLSLPASSIAEEDPLWIDTGAEQFVIPLRTAADVRRAKPSAVLLAKHGFSPLRGASMAYVWSYFESDQSDQSDQSQILARFFFNSHDAVVEDPATGSACANLGGYFVVTGKAGKEGLSRKIHQGEAIGRPSHLHLRVDEDGGIFVAGEVVELGNGTLTL